LIAYYQFNEGQGDIAVDLSVNANNAMPEDAIWCQGKNLDPPVYIQEGLYSNIRQFSMIVYPNPFAGLVFFSYRLKEEAHVSIRIYNATGELVKQLLDTMQSKGEQQISWNARTSSGIKVDGGIYVLQIEVNGQCYSRKIIRK